MLNRHNEIPSVSYSEAGMTRQEIANELGSEKEQIISIISA